MAARPAIPPDMLSGETGIRSKTTYRKLTDPESLSLSIANALKYNLAKDQYTATAHDQFTALATAVRDRLIDRWIKTHQTYYEVDAKRIYILSMEYLIGRTLLNAIINLRLEPQFRAALQELGLTLADLEALEPDAGLGNGGLGRLAACFLDSMATLQLPACGYGIRYDFGMLRQKIVKGRQVEEPDNWLHSGNPWEMMRPEASCVVRFGGHVESTEAGGRARFRWVDGDEVLAMPYDLPIPGYGNNTVNNLRLWSARSTAAFDLTYFNQGDYVGAVERRALSENISKILYPSDRVTVNRELRLKQEYFLVAASLRDIVRRYKKTHETFVAFADKVAVQLNDTHPTLAIPELMRILIDEESLEWDLAWRTTQQVMGFTNHTLLPEALETWPVEMIQRLLPRHLQIIYEINHRFLRQVANRFPGDVGRLGRMSLIQEGPDRRVRMAHLAIVGSHSINGVAELHTQLLRRKLLPDFAEYCPERFNNKTNGVTPRRWMRACNEPLAALITERIGDGWITNLDRLEELRLAAEAPEFCARLRDAKRQNKLRLATLIERTCGLKVDPDAMFDTQVKRFHEYKRQLLNALRAVHLYRRIKEGKLEPDVPRVLIFGGKAAPAYTVAKLIIHLINAVGDVINADPQVGDALKVVFLPDYGVTLAETIIPGSDLSEQISTAGWEASGTGNMKFAMNGALTIGTMDGANVEIREAVGPENIFIFGLTAEEVEAARAAGYDARAQFASNPRLQSVFELINCGFFSPEEPDVFRPIYETVVEGGDRFMVLKDFDAYLECQERVARAYRDPDAWARTAALNIAAMGRFSSDRTIRQYARDIWNVTPVPIVMD
jgi:starch phosphorylase